MTDRVEQWKADYASGLSTHAVAAKHGVHQATVWAYLHERGLTRPRSQTTNALRACADEVVARYREFGSMHAVAEHYEVPIKTVWTVLEEQGEPRAIRKDGAKARIKRTRVRIGRLSRALDALPPHEVDALALAAAERGKSVAEVLVEDWEP